MFVRFVFFRKRIETPVHLNRWCFGFHIFIMVGRVQIGIALKIQDGSHVELSQTMFDGSPQNGVQSRFVVKLDFGLGGMDIDVYGIGRHLKVQKITGLRTVFQKSVVSRHHGMVQITAFDETVIDKEKLLSPIFLGKFGFANKTLNVHDFGFLVHGNQFLVGFTRKNAHDALPEIGRLQIEHFASVVVKREIDLRMRQGHSLKFIHNMSVFHRVRLQEIASGGNIEKQILDGK